MNIDLTGKRAWIGGSSQGIGKAIAIELAKLGADVILVARNEEKLKSVQNEISSYANQEVSYLVADYSDIEDLKKRVESFLETDKKPIQILINNTGGPAPGKAIDASLEDMQKAVNMHLLASHYLAQQFVPHMKDSNYGRIINIESTSVKEPIANLGLSNTVRASVANWAKSLANELAEFNITVNNVLPGTTATTRMDQILKSKAERDGISFEESKNQWMSTIPAGRFAKPEEIAFAVGFLASSSAAYINGINLPVDGGRTKGL